jgi:hypothetical protein
MFSFIGKRSVDYYYKIRKWKIFSQVDWDIFEVISRGLQSPTKPQSLINLSTFRHLLSADILTFWKNRGWSIHSFGRSIAIYIMVLDRLLFLPWSSASVGGSIHLILFSFHGCILSLISMVLLVCFFRSTIMDDL